MNLSDCNVKNKNPNAMPIAMKALILLALILTSVSADAVLVTIEPDDYPDDTVLNNISPYVSLVTAGANNLPIPFGVTAKTDTFNAPTREKVFAHVGVGFWNSDRRLLMTLNQPIDYISIDFAGGWNLNNERGYLDAFDINLNLLDRYITSPLQYGDVETMSVAGANIAFAVAYIPPGLGSFGRLDNLSLNVVPEPSVAALLIVGLSSLLFIRKQK